MERMWRKVNQGLISKPSASGKIRGGGTSGHHHQQSVAAMLAAQESAAAGSTGTISGPVVSFANDYPGTQQQRTQQRDRMSRSSRRSQQSSTIDGAEAVASMMVAGEQFVRSHPSNAIMTNGSSAASTESRRRRRRKSKSRCNKNNRWVVGGRLKYFVQQVNK